MKGVKHKSCAGMWSGVSVLYNGGKEDYREIFVSALVQPRFERLTENGFTQNGVSGEGMIRESGKHIQ